MLFFVLRAIVYFAAWLIVGELLLRWSRQREAGRDVAPGRESALAAGMLPIIALAITFAAFDWLMSLEPTWFSSIFGVYYFAGGFVGGIALVIILAYRASSAGLLSGVDGGLTREHYHAVGRLLFGFIIFWAYVAFFQAMLIRMADKPEEVLFYIHRLSGSWEWVTYALMVGHFAAPFFLLLPRRIKRRPAVLTAIASWVLIFHYLDIYWLVLPMLHEHGARPHWLDLAALAGIGGIATLVAVWRMRGRSLLPVGHPQLEHGLAYRSQSI
jgi:hypothetical protein